MTALDVLVARLGDRRIGLPASIVRHVVPAASIEALPSAPLIVKGVLNVRGTLLPVLDLRRRFAMPSEPLHPDQHFVLAQAGPRPVVLHVDRVTDLIRVDDEQLVSPVDVVPGVQYAASLARMPDGVIVIHDVESFLSLDEARALDRALAAAESGSDPEAAT